MPQRPGHPVTMLPPLLRRSFAEALDVLWPVSCAACQAPASALCDTCLDSWQPQRDVLDDRTLVTLGDYEGPLRDAVLACKEQGSVAVARRLADALAPAFGEADAVAVVPPSVAGLRRRGFHAAHWAARRIASATGAQVVKLRFTGETDGTQKQRGRDARVAADRTMRAPKRLAGRRVILFDDVVTTGATMRAAVTAVEEAAGTVQAIVAIARTPLRDHLGLGNQRR